MANDIRVAVSGQPIKHGAAVISTTQTGEYETLDTYVFNTPVIADIQDKYDTRLDDPRYYTGDTAN